MKEKITLKEIAAILIGMFFVSAAVYYIMMPGGFVVGSLSGLVMVLAHFIPLSVSNLTFILNLLLLLAGFLLIGKDFGAKTVITSFLLPVYLWIFEAVTPEVKPLTEDMFVNVLCFILILSVGQAILFNINASSGGLDIIGKLMNRYLHMDLGKSLAIAGFVVAATSILVYDREVLVVSLLGTYLGGVALDYFIDGAHIRKKITIISEQYPEIQEFVVQKLKRGVTLYEARGGWDNSPRVTLVTILQKNEYAQLLAFVSRKDPHAFITVSTVGEVIGKWNAHVRNLKY